MSDLASVLRFVPKSRGREKGGKWVASCEWNGRTIEAVSRNGAVYALCRELVAAGCPDQPMRVYGPEGRLSLYGPEGRLSLTIRSIYVAAGRTIKEGSTTTIREAAYSAHPLATMPPEGQNRGISPSEVPGEGSAELRVYGQSVGVGDRHAFIEAAIK